MSMISAGVLNEVSKAMKLPAGFEQKTFIEHAKYAIAKAGVQTALNVSFKKQSLSDALKVGIVDIITTTCANTMLNELSVQHKQGQLDLISHKLFNTILGGVEGAIINGEKGAIAGMLAAYSTETLLQLFGNEKVVADAINEHSADATNNPNKQQLLKQADKARVISSIISLLANTDIATANKITERHLTEGFLILPEPQDRDSIANLDIGQQSPTQQELLVNGEAANQSMSTEQEGNLAGVDIDLEEAEYLAESELDVLNEQLKQQKQTYYSKNLFAEELSRAKLLSSTGAITLDEAAIIDSEESSSDLLEKTTEIAKRVGRSALSVGGRLGIGTALAVWPRELDGGVLPPSEIEHPTQSNSQNKSSSSDTTWMYRKEQGATFSKSLVEEVTGTTVGMQPPPPDDDNLFDRMIRCEKGKYSRIKGTDLWATRDNRAMGGFSHGGVYWKVYKQVGKKLVHQYETDELFNVINKHKSDVGKIIDPKKSCKGIPGWKGF